MAQYPPKMENLLTLNKFLFYLKVYFTVSLLLTETLCMQDIILNSSKKCIIIKFSIYHNFFFTQLNSNTVAPP